MTKYVFITGGVLSGIGKGVVAASIAKLFQFRGYKVDMIKIDPYLNVDPGTLNPIEHGEVFVCEESWKFKPAENFEFTIAEIDQDFGTYERFLDINMHPSNNITSGQVYLSVILKERYGEYLGKTIQVIPHITEEVKRRIRSVAERTKPDVLIVEVGGTVGDIEAMPFLEAIRQMRLYMPKDIVLVHVTLVPFLETVGQYKTKPTQHSVKTLQSMGLQPDIIIGRSKGFLTDDAREKISLYCNVPPEAVISDPDIDTIYELPLLFEEQGLGSLLVKKLGLKEPPIRNEAKRWSRIVSSFKEFKDKVIIAMPGKYTVISDSYISINEALKHAAAKERLLVDIIFLDSSKYEKDPHILERDLLHVDGILLTPGFGSRGVEGMIATAKYAIEKDLPFLGICFGAQLLFIAFNRYVVGLKDAHSTEVNPNTSYPVVDLLPEQRGLRIKGGSMRLASHPVKILPGTKLHEAYKTKMVYERFRHRYHIIPKYAELGKKYGLIVSATDPQEKVINAIELKNKKWIVGVQFHPEFKSRPGKPSPIYNAFIKATYEHKKAKKALIVSR